MVTSMGEKVDIVRELRGAAGREREILDTGFNMQGMKTAAA